MWNSELSQGIQIWEDESNSCLQIAGTKPSYIFYLWRIA